MPADQMSMMDSAPATLANQQQGDAPSAQDWTAVACFLMGFLVLYVPTYIHLAETTWATDEQGHGPLIVAASAWLLWSGRGRILTSDRRPALLAGWCFLILGLLCYVVGRSQSVIELEAGSQLFVLAGGCLLVQGWQALKFAWFPICFLVFSVPMPGALVQALTMPLKQAVSAVVESLLHSAGYPIGRSGVTLAIGPYELLVADACSGLNSLFTLEALGLLYMKVMGYQSRRRNLLLAAMIVPISFVSNVTRVVILVLVTYYFGADAGQGFIHSFAGLVLFTVALLLTFAFDHLLAARFDGGTRVRR